MPTHPFPLVRSWGVEVEGLPVGRESQSIPLPAEELWVEESRQPGNRSANQFNQRLVSTPGSSKGVGMPSPLWSLTLSLVCPGKIQVVAHAEEGSKSLWKRKWVGEALAMVPECNQTLKGWKTEERGSPCAPIPDVPRDPVLQLGDPRRTLAPGWMQGHWDWISGVMNIHQPEPASASVYLAGRGRVSGSP